MLIQAPLRVLNSIEGLLRGLARGVQLPRATPGQRPECLAQSPDGKGAEGRFVLGPGRAVLHLLGEFAKGLGFGVGGFLGLAARLLQLVEDGVAVAPKGGPEGPVDLPRRDVDFCPAPLERLALISGFPTALGDEGLGLRYEGPLGLHVRLPAGLELGLQTAHAREERARQAPSTMIHGLVLPPLGIALAIEAIEGFPIGRLPVHRIEGLLEGL